MDHNHHYTKRETQAMRDYYICLRLYYLKGLKSVLNSGFLVADKSFSYFTSKLHSRGLGLGNAGNWSAEERFKNIFGLITLVLLQPHKIRHYNPQIGKNKIYIANIWSGG